VLWAQTSIGSLTITRSLKGRHAGGNQNDGDPCRTAGPPAEFRNGQRGGHWLVGRLVLGPCRNGEIAPDPSTDIRSRGLPIVMAGPRVGPQALPRTSLPVPAIPVWPWVTPNNYRFSGFALLLSSPGLTR
jgi:hypothetical protein